jgi:ABC-type Mn2+/Zn2+ transport system ATPase subunit
VGYVPQRGRLDPLFPLHVLDVVAMGALGQYAHGRCFRFAPAAKAQAALAEVGVGDLAAHTFRSLSGGQQQRVLIARALVRSPQLLVLDEPTAGMDLPSERDLMALISNLPKLKKMAVIFVTHELTLAAGHAKRIAFISKYRQLFRIDQAAAIMTPESLSELYGRPMTISNHAGEQVIRPALPLE